MKIFLTSAAVLALLASPVLAQSTMPSKSQSDAGAFPSHCASGPPGYKQAMKDSVADNEAKANSGSAGTAANLGIGTAVAPDKRPETTASLDPNSAEAVKSHAPGADCPE